MLSGDFATMGLADVLQWIDATRGSGVLGIERSAESLWIQVRSRTIVRVSEPPNRPVPLSALGGDDLPVDVATLSADLAIEHLYDQFLDGDGRFTFDANGDRTDGISVDVPLVEVLMESLRLLDEWPAVQSRFPTEVGHLEVVGGEPASPSRVQRAVIECAKRRLTMERTRWALGLSRPALLRKVSELSSMGVIAVPGVEPPEDITARLIAQARTLVREKQFDEAAHVFSALLASDPGASSVRHLLRSAEEQQLEWLRTELPGSVIPERIVPEPETGLLTNADREVLSRVNGRWDVAVHVLVSRFRETETLKSLRKLVRTRTIRLTARAGSSR